MRLLVQMRILNITANYLSDHKTDISGVFIHRQWVKLAEFDCEIKVINPQPYMYRWFQKRVKYYPGKSVRDGITILRPRFLKFRKTDVSQFQFDQYNRAIKRAFKGLSGWTPDVIVCDWLVPGMPAAVELANVCDVPLVARARGEDVRQLQYTQEQQNGLVERYRVLGHKPSLVICNGNELYQDVLNLKLFDSARVIDRPNGLDLELYRSITVEERNAARESFGISDDMVLWLFVGRWEKAKGSQILADILPELTSVLPQLFFASVGPINDWASYNQLRNENQVIFMGAVEPKRVASLLGAADGFVLPSFYEGTPNALLEAMASGLSCVTTPVGGVKAIASHGENLVLVEPGERQSLSNAISHLTNNMPLRQQLGKAARQTIVSKGYDLNSVVEELYNLFHECIQSHEAP